MLMAPDHDNNAEMWLVIQFVSGFARANEWVFLGVLLLLIGYAVVRLTFAVVRYMFMLYQQRLSETGPHVRHFRIALGVATAVALVGGLLATSIQYKAIGIAILANDFCFFSLFSVAYDWYLSRRTPQIDMLPEDTTYDDIVEWQSQVNEAYDAGLMMKA